MTRLARRYEVGVSAAVVAVFAAAWAITLATSPPPEFPSQYALSALFMTVVAVPWVAVVRFLWRAWWARDLAGLPVVDGPAVLLAAAVATLPDDRRDWGQALTAELPHVAGRSARWWFAFGGARTALFPPGGRRAPILNTGGLAMLAAGAVWLLAGALLPAVQVFGLVFVTLVGVLAILAVARRRGGRWLAADPLIGTAGLAGVAAALAVTVHFLVQNPRAAAYLTPAAAVILAVVLAGGLWLTIAPPSGLTTSRLAGRLGVGAALLLGLGFLLTARSPFALAGGVMIWIVLAPIVLAFAVAAVAAAVGRSVRAGVQATVWAILLGTLVMFAVWLPEASLRYAFDRGLLFDGDGGKAIGVNLADAIGMLLLVPGLGLPIGVIGAAFGVDGSLRAIGLKPPQSPARASLLLCLPMVALVLIAEQELLPFKHWFAADQPLAPVGQAMIVGSLVCLLLALVYGLTTLWRLGARLISAARQRQ